MILLLLKKFLVGKIEIIDYDDIVIICSKYRKNLRPNIYITTKILGVGSTIRGDVIITSKNSENLKGLTKEQAKEYLKLLERISFHYKDIKKRNKKFNKKQSNVLSDDNKVAKKEKYGRDEVLRMILAIQSIILEFINKHEN